MNQKALQYHMNYYLRQIGICGLIFLGFVVMTLLLNYFFVDRVAIIYSGAEFIFIVFCFVLSLAEYRKSLRSMIQVGVSRQTTWLSTLLSIAVSATVLASVWVLYTKGLRLFNAQAVVVYDIYSLLYQHVGSVVAWLLNMLSFMLAYYLGLCINLVYAHLEKPGIIAVSVGVPVGINLLFIIDGMLGGERVIRHLIAFGKWFSLTWVNAFVFYLGSLLIFITLSYFLNRRLTVVKGEMV